MLVAELCGVKANTLILNQGTKEFFRILEGG